MHLKIKFDFTNKEIQIIKRQTRGAKLTFKEREKLETLTMVNSAKVDEILKESEGY